MNKTCDKCQIGEIENNRCWWCNSYFPFPNDNNQGERAEASLYFPETHDYFGGDDKRSYEMREIKPGTLSGKNATKYRWFICTPDFPSEQHKINDPHCHIWPRDGRGKVRVSLFPIKVKHKGRVKDTDLTEIEELVINNIAIIHKEWKEEWIYKK